LRYVLDIAYKGTNYHGWQIQDNAHSVQAELQKALRIFLGKETDTMGSGRTDTGVHATQQFVQFDWEETINPALIVFKLNILLPKDIVVNRFFEVDGGFSVRFDAILRSYEYRIIRKKDPFLKELSYHFFKPLDVQLMNEAAAILLRYKDYECFSKTRTSVDHFLCNITRAEWIEKEDSLIFYITANRFLRGMVRAIVGTLLNVGLNRLDLVGFENIILNKDRKQAGRSVPPEALFLVKVDYGNKL